MAFTYKTGETVMKGDRILLNGNPGEVECVADPIETPDDWLVRQYGGGFMLIVPKTFGRLFLTPLDSDDEDLVFVSRLQTEP